MVWQVQCQVRGCDTGGVNQVGVFQVGAYLTDPDCGTVTERSEDLKAHIAMVHDRDRMEFKSAAKKRLRLRLRNLLHKLKCTRQRQPGWRLLMDPQHLAT